MAWRARSIYILVPLLVPLLLIMAWGMGVVDFNRPLALTAFLVLPLLGWLTMRSIVGLPTRVIRWAHAMRVIVVTLLVCGLADLQWVLREDGLAVIFVVDQSASIPEAVQHDAFAYVRAAAETRRAGDRAGMVVFGERASIEVPPTSQFSLNSIRSEVGRELTDIAEALQLAVAALPTDMRRKVVLISDGNENMGHLLTATRSLRGSGIELDVLPVHYEYPDEVWVRSLQVPEDVKKDETFDVRISIRSLTANRGMLRIARNGMPIAERQVDLRPGDNSFVMTLSEAVTGVHQLSARIFPERDHLPANNEAHAHLRVEGQARVLIIAPTMLEAQYLVAVCRDEGIEPDVVLPEDALLTPAILQGYDLFILANVESGSFSRDEMRAMRSAVRDMGVGMIMVGGMNSFGMGNYRETPVEEALPVDMDLKNKKVMPNGALIVLVDRSGSMAGDRLELAKQAAWAAVEVLSPGDYAGVIAFDGAPTWQSKPTVLGADRASIRRDIFSLEAGGGTDIMAAMREAHQVMRGIDASLRHLILLSDGQSPHHGLDELMEAMKQDRITVSSIGIGDQGGQPLMVEIARRGGGQSYFVDDPRALPRIFIKEAMVVKRSLIFNTPFQPLLVRPHEAMKGLDPHTIPPLLAYVATTPKDTAEVPMVSDNENRDPIVAAWRFGLGKSVAFTSDATSNWAQFWVEWEGFGKFWGQVLHWSIRQRSAETFRVQTILDGHEGKIIVDAIDDVGAFVNFLQLEGRLVDSGTEGHPLTFRQAAPGRYEASFDATRAGINLLSIGYTDPRTGQQVFVNSGIDVPHAPEYRTVRADVDLLRAVADIGGGRVLGGDPLLDGIFRSDQPPHHSQQPIWSYLMMAAILLLFVDIVLRRVIFTREDLQQVQAKVRSWRTPAQAEQTVHSVLRQKRRPQAATAETPPPVAPDGTPPVEVEPVFGRQADNLPMRSAPVSDKGAPAESYFGKLREAKRRAREQMTDAERDK